MKFSFTSKRRDVAIFRIGNFGDTLVALPAIHRIAEQNPGSRLWLITNTSSASQVSSWDVLEHTRLFAGVLYYERRSVRALLRLALRCQRFHGAKLYYLMPARSEAALRRDRWFFRVLCGFREIAAVESAPLPAARGADGRLLVLPRECDRLLRTVDASAPILHAPLLRPPESTQARADSLLARVRGRPLLALGAGSKMPAKKWFHERYAELCRRSSAQFPELGLAVFGGPEDKAEGNALVDIFGPERACNLAGETNIIESAAAMQRCSLYLGNDTGTMHLAAIMGLPCVCVFTSRDNRDSWVPWGESHIVLRHDLPCSGCLLERCELERMRCLDLITVAEVWAALEPRLASLTRAVHTA